MTWTTGVTLAAVETEGGSTSVLPFSQGGGAMRAHVPSSGYGNRAQVFKRSFA